MRHTLAITVESAAEERSLDAARGLIRAHFEAHSEVHGLAEINTVIDRLPEPYVPPLGGLWVAWLGETAAGCVALQPLSEDAGEVKRMYVRPSGRGEGLGAALLDRLIEEARALDATTLRLDTCRFMTDAQRLYRSRGFQERDPYPESEIPPRIQRHWLFFELDLRAQPVLRLR